MTNEQLTRIAIAVDTAARRKAWAGMQRELNAPPPRQPVTYSGCKTPINTHERAMRLKAKR